MDIILWPFRAIYKIYFLIVFALSLLILYPLFYITLSKEKWFKYTFKLKWFWGRFLQFAGGIILSVKKSELPSKPYIICPNHSSYMDIILMYLVFPDYFVFMGKQEIQNWPLLHIFFTRKMDIYVNRNSKMGAHQAYLDASEAISKGHSIVIFPEATIPNSAPHLKGFKNGAFKLAINKQIPIVPVTFTTNWKRIQGTVLLKGKASPGISRCLIHPYVETKGMTEVDMVPLKKKIYDIINKPLVELYGAQPKRP